MEAKFAHLDSILFGIKENLTDGQYLDVMTTVHDIYKWCESRKVVYEEDDEDPDLGEDDRHLHIASDEDDEEDAFQGCGLDHGHYSFCTNSLDAFANCSNLRVALELLPILADLLEGADPAATYQLQTTPAIGELNESDVKQTLSNLININHTVTGGKKVVSAIALFDFAMRHFNRITISPGLVCSMYSKTFGATDQRPDDLVKFNVAEPPFVLFKRALRPFVEIAPEEIRARFNITDIA